VKSQLKKLRDTGYVNAQGSGRHAIARNRIMEVLGLIEKKVGA
jgi:hypothetical protein